MLIPAAQPRKLPGALRLAESAARAPPIPAELRLPRLGELWRLQPAVPRQLQPAELPRLQLVVLRRFRPAERRRAGKSVPEATHRQVGRPSPLAGRSLLQRVELRPPGPAGIPRSARAARR